MTLPIMNFIDQLFKNLGIQWRKVKDLMTFKNCMTPTQNVNSSVEYFSVIRSSSKAGPLVHSTPLNGKTF